VAEGVKVGLGGRAVLLAVAVKVGGIRVKVDVGGRGVNVLLVAGKGV
jgi:hypothetical protein